MAEKKVLESENSSQLHFNDHLNGDGNQVEDEQEIETLPGIGPFPSPRTMVFNPKEHLPPHLTQKGIDSAKEVVNKAKETIEPVLMNLTSTLTQTKQRDSFEEYEEEMEEEEEEDVEEVEEEDEEGLDLEYNPPALQHQDQLLSGGSPKIHRTSLHFDNFFSNPSKTNESTKPKEDNVLTTILKENPVYQPKENIETKEGSLPINLASVPTYKLESLNTRPKTPELPSSTLNKESSPVPSSHFQPVVSEKQNTSEPNSPEDIVSLPSYSLESISTRQKLPDPVKSVPADIDIPKKEFIPQNIKPVVTSTSVPESPLPKPELSTSNLEDKHPEVTSHSSCEESSSDSEPSSPPETSSGYSSWISYCNIL